MKNLYISLMALPLFAFANFGVGITSHDIDDEGLGYGSLSWRLATLNGVYENRNDNLAFQAKVGLGLSDDSSDDSDGDAHDLELNNYVQLKGMYFMNNNIYAAFTYSRIDFDIYVSWQDETYGDSMNDFGFQLGYRDNNLDIFVGPSLDKDGSEILEIGFTYFFN